MEVLTCGVKRQRPEFHYPSVSSGIMRSPFKLLNQFIYFLEYWYEPYATGNCLNTVLLIFLAWALLRRS